MEKAYLLESRFLEMRDPDVALLLRLAHIERRAVPRQVRITADEVPSRRRREGNFVELRGDDGNSKFQRSPLLPTEVRRLDFCRASTDRRRSM